MIVTFADELAAPPTPITPPLLVASLRTVAPPSRWNVAIARLPPVEVELSRGCPGFQFYCAPRSCGIVWRTVGRLHDERSVLSSRRLGGHDERSVLSSGRLGC